MAQYIQSNEVIQLPYTATTLTLADSGKTLMTPQTAGAVSVTYTLPDVLAAIGCHYRFINGAAAALSGSVIIAGAAANLLRGVVIQGPVGAPLSVSVAGSSNIRFVTAASLRGDYIDLYSDGVCWLVSAVTAIAVAITVA
jgi:hypothetical protein